MDFDQTCIDTLWEEGKSWLDFGDLDIIFKVTMTQWNVQIRGLVSYALNQWMEINQTCLDIFLGVGEDWIIFLVTFT